MIKNNKCIHTSDNYPYCDALIPQYADNTEEASYRKGDEYCNKEKCEAYEEKQTKLDRIQEGVNRYFSQPYEVGGKSTLYCLEDIKLILDEKE